MGDFRPISLTSCPCKITRLSERLKSCLLPYLIFFNPLLLDASLIANVLTGEWKRKTEKGMAIKLDVEKAFDMVDWNFLDEILCVEGFRIKWRRWIQGCNSTANYFIIINGKPRGRIRVTRGLR